MKNLRNILFASAVTGLGLVGLAGCDQEKTTIKKSTASVPGYVTGVAIGDINGDGKNDIVTVSSNGTPGGNGPSYVYILINKGDGNYESQEVTVKPEKEKQ